MSASGVLRSFAAKNSKIEVRWQTYWNRGDYAPEPEVNPVPWQAYVQMNTSIVTLDGYPRTYRQVDDFLEKGGRISATILLAVEQSIALSRIVDRSQQLGRFDDSAEVARRRIQGEIAKLSTLTVHKEIRRTLTIIDAGLTKTEVADKAIRVVARIIEGS